MSRVYLQEMLDDIRFDSLPVNWNAFDIESFSRTKKLWDYQRKAVENAIKALCKFYEDFGDYQTNENAATNRERKLRFFKWYQDNGLDDPMDIPLAQTQKLAGLLSEYYTVQDEKISYDQFINRGCFWMATGSGKTLVLLKLIEVLRGLIQRGEIPPHDILVLSYRDDLIEQLRKHVQEFNAAHTDLFIHLRELREYADAKRDNPVLFKEHELTVFYYRSDNLSDEQKERIVDFRNYDDGGKWYVLLDEAHKGDREDSKRQHIYSMLSRNGFLFNFSATFTDVRDLTTTVYNFNLAEFTKAGYGKHITILQQELRAFRDDQDYSNEEKQKIVLKSLLMLAYVQEFSEKVRKTRADLYHKPLLLTLVNSVNTDEADLQLFFRELERIGRGEVPKGVWESAITELWGELKERPALMFEDDQSIRIDEAVFHSLTHKRILQKVYNASTPGEIEILVRPSNKHEIAFKLKTADRPFALIKIGDISGWLKDKLSGYEIVEGFEDEGYFEGLNADDSDIRILMGSRSFYEGWDSNRPNVTNFVNIGMGADARKFILQAVGRGVRIEPIKNKRKRLLPLYNANEVDEDLFNRIKNSVQPLETLVIFGTNRQALKTVISELQTQRGLDIRLSLVVNQAAESNKLLVPVYRESSTSLAAESMVAKFELAPPELELLKKFAEYVSDDRVLLAMYNASPERVKVLRDSLTAPQEWYRTDGKAIKNLDILVSRVLSYFNIVPKELEGLKELDNEIKHFRNIRVSLADVTELQNKVEKVKNYPVRAKELQEQYGKIPVEEYIRKAGGLANTETYESSGGKIRIKYVANHYYVPIILSASERVEFIKHIIVTPSEINFVNDLEDYCQKTESRFKQFDRWLFSKLDASLDMVYIPYYDPKVNGIRAFNPDFVFWLQKGDNYFIVFVDPKGTEHTDYQRKVDGYRRIFEDGANGLRILAYDKLKVRVALYLYTADKNLVPEGYRKYWFDSIDGVLSRLLSS